MNGTDEDFKNYYYVGDTYCCNVKTVQLTKTSFQVDDTVVVEGHDFKVIEVNETGYGIPDPEEPQVYRYWIALQVINPQVGKAYSYVLGKRNAD
jgi:hypothetical protein